MMKTLSTRFGAILLVATASAAPLACGSDDSGTTEPETAPDAVVISMLDNRFEPSSETVEVGQPVRWENKGNNSHTTTREGDWDITVEPGGSASRTFGVAGTYEYECTFHSGMTGTLTVVE